MDTAREIKLISPGGIRLSSLLKRELDASRALMTELKKSPCGVLAGGLPARLSDVPAAGTEIELRIPESFAEEGKESNLAPSPAPAASVVWRGEDFAVLLKPAGMPSHPSRAHVYDTLANDFAALLPGYVYRPITRLDADTSGLVLTALNKCAANIDRGSVERIYYGITDRPLPYTSGVIDAPIERSEEYSPVRAVREDGKPARTRYRLAAVKNGLTLVRFKLETGRTHQIRVHCAAMGFPLCGDALYGGTPLPELDRQALHAAFLRFTDPLTGERVSVRSALPDDMRRLLL